MTGLLMFWRLSAKPTPRAKNVLEWIPQWGRVQTEHVNTLKSTRFEKWGAASSWRHQFSATSSVLSDQAWVWLLPAAAPHPQSSHRHLFLECFPSWRLNLCRQPAGHSWWNAMTYNLSLFFSFSGKFNPTLSVCSEASPQHHFRSNQGC